MRCSRTLIHHIFKIKILLLFFAATAIFAFAQDDVASSTSATEQSTETFPEALEGNMSTEPQDSMQIAQDTVRTAKNKSTIESEINYNAKDSIVFYRDGRGFFFGESVVKYQEIQLESDFIAVNIDSSLVHATGVPDSTGVISRNPVFTDKEESFESKDIRYNFQTKKGFVIHTVTQQGEGFVISEQAKKMADDVLFMKNGRYTTCDLHEHPHFYLNLTKAKVRPGKNIVTGPAYLVIADVPLPLVLPFGYFPFNSNYSSGIIMPTFGDELTRGFYLANGGYYFAFSDYFDAALTGDIYTNLSWRANLSSTYLRRYKFRGNVSMEYMVNHFDRDVPDLHTVSKDFRVMWTHSKDTRSNPDLSLSASVNYATSRFEHNNLNSLFNPDVLSQNTRSSSVSLTKRFAGTPFMLTSSARAQQTSSIATVDLVLPDMNFSMSRIQPFRRKNRIGRERWYEKIAMSYTGKMSNSITAEEDELKHTKFPQDWRNGVMHTIPVSASFNVLKYISVTPSINYNERWYFESVKRDWDRENTVEVIDTIRGFNRVFDYNFNISANTRLYGFFKPLPIFGEKIDMIRWVITPTVGYGMRPDFGAEKFGYWNSYFRTDVNGQEREVFYSPFEGSLYGVPGRGKSSSVNFSLANNVEMKVKSTRGDSIDVKKISLIENFSASSSYNFVADEFQLSNINTNLRLRFTPNFGLSLSAAFDPYEYGFDSDDNLSNIDKFNRGDAIRRVNEYRWNNGRLPQLVGTGTSFGYSFSNDTFKRKKKENEAQNPDATTASGTSEKPKVDDSGYAVFSLPWNLSVDYSMDYRRSSRREDFDVDKMQYRHVFTHNISFSGSLSLTENWRINGSAHYNISEKEIAYTNVGITRNLHCWSMSANFVPVGAFRSYNFMISVNSTLLRDLKYEQRSNPRDNTIW